MSDLARYARRKWALSFPVALVFAAASYAWADFGPPQGSGGGGGGVSNPLTADLDAGGYSLTEVDTVVGATGGNLTLQGQGSGKVVVSGDSDLVLDGSVGLLAIGGTGASTFPALRYGSSAGVIETLRADGTAGSVTVRPSSGNTLSFEGVSDIQVNGITYVDRLEALNDGAIDLEGTAYVGSGSALHVTGSGGLTLKDVSAPSVTAGYQGLYSLNTSGLQQLVVKGGSGAVTLATQGIYAAGAHVALARTSDQTFTNASENISWSSASVNQWSLHDNATAPTKAITAPVAGVFRFWVAPRWAVNSTDTVRSVYVRRYNSSDSLQQSVVKQEYWAVGVVAQNQLANFELHMGAGDYILVQGYIPDMDGTPSLDMDDAGAGAPACTLEGFFVPD